MEASGRSSTQGTDFDLRVDRVIGQVLKNAVADDFKGHDPYDILKSPIPFRMFGTFFAAVATQLHKRNPVDLRPILGIKKGINPKSTGILLDAVCSLQRLHPDRDYSDILKRLSGLAEQTVTKGYSGACWGYDFGWASPGKFLPPFAPSGVVTAFVAKGLFSHYLLTGEPTSRQLVESAADFVMRDLHQTKFESGIAFSYTPFKRDVCYNASLLAAETVARAFSISKKQDFKAVSTEAVRYVVSRQKEDGRWNYSLDPDSGIEREQVDFHQGYVIDALQSITDLTDSGSESVNDAVRKGLKFYRENQFAPDGQSLWRYPRRYPVDIHNQSQGIITFARAGRRFNDPVLTGFARSVADWTIDTMYDESRGHFHYRKYPFFSNRIPYLRWADAWMLLALAELRTGKV